MYVAKHDRDFTSDKVTSALDRHALTCKAVDEQGTLFAQLQDVHSLATGKLPQGPIESDVVNVRTRYVPTSLALEVDEQVDRREQADMFLAGRFLGKQ